MPDINPQIVDGEPVCNEEDCPCYDTCEFSSLSFDDPPCVPGLRRQRDEARAALVAEREMVKAACPGCDRVERAEAEVERLLARMKEINDAVEDREGFILGGPARLCGTLIRISRAALAEKEQG